MALVVVCGEETLVRTLTRTHLQEFGVVAVYGLSLTGRPGVVTAQVVIVCTREIGPRETTALPQLKRAAPLAHVLLVTRITSKNVRALADMPDMLAGIMSPEEAHADVERRVWALLGRPCLEGAADRLVRLSDFPSTARWFIKRTWLDPRPPVSVTEAARDIGVYPSTLYENWPMDEPPRALVDWALLVRARAVRMDRRSWVRAAERVRVTKRRLQRVSGRCLNCTLEELDSRGDEWVEQRFRAWLAEAIPGGDADDVSA